MFKGKYITMKAEKDKIRYADPHRIMIKTADEIRVELQRLLDDELERVEELHKAIEALDAAPRPVTQTMVKPTRYPPGASGVKKQEA